MPGNYVASFIWTSTKNEWNAQNATLLRAFGPSITRYLITCVLAIYHSLSDHACFGHLSRETYATQATVLEQQSV